MSASANRRVIQYCASLGKACGISTYTQMLSEGQGLEAVKSLDELNPAEVSHLHVQHEFGIMKEKDLRAIEAFCRRHGIRWFVTMHTVIPMPSARDYLGHWSRKKLAPWKRRLRSAPDRLIVKPAGACIRGVDGLLLSGRFRLWERANRWKNRGKKLSVQAAIAQMKFPSAPRLSPPWVWTRENPDYDLRSFWFFRTSQNRIIRGADTIVVHSEEAKKTLMEMGARSVQVVAHGLHEYRTSKKLLSEKDGKLHIGCFGFMKAHKSLLKIIEACEGMLNVKLHIYASTAHSDQQSAYLKAVLNRIRQKEWIELETAHLPLDAVVYRLSQCDVNVWYCAAPGAISTSGSIRQYLAAKRPIVAADNIMISDIRHLVETVPHGDPALLAEKLQSFRSDTSGIERYVAEHGWEKLQPSYVS